MVACFTRICVVLTLVWSILMFSEADIVAKAWLTIEVVNLVLIDEGRTVDKIFLIGSYANGTQNHSSDLDFLVQLKGGSRPGLYYVNWDQANIIKRKLGNRIHVIFGTELAAQRLHDKHKSEVKNYRYKEISQGRIINAYSYSSNLTQ